MPVRCLCRDLRSWLPEATISAEGIVLSCVPSGLLFGRLDVAKLHGRGVSIVDTGPKKKEPLSFIPPHVPRIVAALRWSIQDLSIQGLSYGRPSENPLSIDRIAGRAQWYRGGLYVRDLVMTAPSGEIWGRLDVGFYRPFLKSELWIHAKETRAGLNKLLIRSNLKPLFARAAMAGDVSAWVYGDEENRLTMEARLSASEHVLNIGTLKMTRPGHGGALRISGRLDGDKASPSFVVKAELDRFSLGDLLPGGAVMAGSLDAAGSIDKYSGGFRFSHGAKDWRAFKVEGRLQGDRRGITADIARGEWLRGDMTGSTTIGWQKDLQITGALSARGLKTAVIDESWQGVINGSGSFRFHRPASGAPTAALTARLLDSTFRERSIKGVVDLVYEKDTLRLTELDLKGRGFDVFAKGNLGDRIDVKANIQDLSSIIPGSKGVISGHGWLRYAKGDLAMDVAATGKTIQYGTARIGRVDVAAGLAQGAARDLHIEARGQSISYGGVDLDAIQGAVKGRISGHEVSLKAMGLGGRMVATATGGYEKGVWKGLLRELGGSDKGRGEWHLTRAVSLVLSRKRIAIDPLILQGPGGERVSGEIDLALEPTHGFIKAEWHNLDLSRFDSMMPVSIHVRANGQGLLQWRQGTLDRMETVAAAQGGQLIYEGSPLNLSRVKMTIDWASKGLEGTGEVILADGGTLRGEISSALKPVLGLPEQAYFSVLWQNINLGLIKPALPTEMGLTGQMAGSLRGKLLPDKKIEAALEFKVARGDFTWRTDSGSARAAIENAALQATWGGEDMKGQMSLELAKQGRLQGSYQLPIPARFPIRMVRSAPLAVRLDGQMQEEGILSAFAPGLVQETKGSVRVNAQVTGTLDRPRLAGGAQLSNAGAYLPTAGITIKAVSAKIALSESSVTVEEFHAESGPGRIDGSGIIWLKDGSIERFSGKLAGNRFQALYLPDLRLLVSPSLNISGTGKRVAIDGEINVPQLLVYGPPTENVVRASPDVVMVGGREKQKRKLPVELQTKVRVVLGDDVRIKMQGVDAQLEGSVLLDMKDVEDISGTGEIRIAKGQYRAYGVELQVTRGKMVFSGPLQRGRLDILAVRKIEGIVRSTQTTERLTGSTTKGSARTSSTQASIIGNGTTETQLVGVQVAGLIQKPRISLYSNPPLSDSDTLSYLVLGRPVSGDAAQASLLFGAAGSLFGGGKAGSIQEQLKKTLGLETLEIATQKVATEQGQVEQTMVRVGRYLAPNLYVGFGRSLFTDEYVVTARYNLSKRWEIQTRTGTQTGGDIYYKVEFD